MSTSLDTRLDHLIDTLPLTYARDARQIKQDLGTLYRTLQQLNQHDTSIWTWPTPLAQFLRELEIFVASLEALKNDPYLPPEFEDYLNDSLRNLNRVQKNFRGVQLSEEYIHRRQRCSQVMLCVVGLMGMGMFYAVSYL